LFRQLIRAIFGERLATTRLSQEKFNVFWGLPILASDAISSVDGYWDTNEKPMANALVFLDENGNLTLDDTEWSVETDENGQYRFVGLEPGT
jgi:hypothetical protein